jgi:hypothetical protein
MRGTHLILGFSGVETARLCFKRTYKRLRLRESHQNYTSILAANALRMRDQYDNVSQKKLLRVMISNAIRNLAQQTITNITIDPIYPFLEAQQDFQSISIYTRNQSMAL